jgi:hypothetical protein
VARRIDNCAECGHTRRILSLGLCVTCLRDPIARAKRPAPPPYSGAQHQCDASDDLPPSYRAQLRDRLDRYQRRADAGLPVCDGRAEFVDVPMESPTR